MPRRFNKSTTQQHDVKYPGYPTATLHIIIKNYELARQGDAGMQAFLIRQYKAVVKIDPSVFLDWNMLSLKPVGRPVGPTPHIKKPNSRLPGGAPVPKPETYGCTCPKDCAACGQGWCNSCRYGCKYGQVIR